MKPSSPEHDTLRVVTAAYGASTGLVGAFAFLIVMLQRNWYLRVIADGTMTGLPETMYHLQTILLIVAATLAAVGVAHLLAARAMQLGRPSALSVMRFVACGTLAWATAWATTITLTVPHFYGKEFPVPDAMLYLFCGIFSAAFCLLFAAPAFWQLFAIRRLRAPRR